MTFLIFFLYLISFVFVTPALTRFTHYIPFLKLDTVVFPCHITISSFIYVSLHFLHLLQYIFFVLSTFLLHIPFSWQIYLRYLCTAFLTSFPDPSSLTCILLSYATLYGISLCVTVSCTSPHFLHFISTLHMF